MIVGPHPPMVNLFPRRHLVADLSDSLPWLFQTSGSAATLRDAPWEKPRKLVKHKSIPPTKHQKKQGLTGLEKGFFIFSERLPPKKTWWSYMTYSILDAWLGHSLGLRLIIDHLAGTFHTSSYSKASNHIACPIHWIPWCSPKPSSIRYL